MLLACQRDSQSCVSLPWHMSAIIDSLQYAIIEGADSRNLIPAALWERTGLLQVRRAANVGGGGGRLANCNSAVADKADAVEYMFRHRVARRSHGCDGVSVGD